MRILGNLWVLFCMSTPVEKASALKQIKMILMLTFFTVGPIGACALIYRNVAGADFAESCEANADCKVGLMCFEKTCTRGCELDTECPENWRCGELAITRKKLGVEFAGGEVKACIPPSKLSNSIRDSISGVSANFEITRKRSLTSSQVMTLAEVSHQPLTPEEFEAEWEAIPEADRARLEPEALAKRIVDARADRESPPKAKQ